MYSATDQDPRLALASEVPNYARGGVPKLGGGYTFWGGVYGTGHNMWYSGGLHEGAPI